VARAYGHAEEPAGEAAFSFGRGGSSGLLEHSVVGDGLSSSRAVKVGCVIVLLVVLVLVVLELVELGLGGGGGRARI
jgi:hypothetical protein